LSELCSFLLKNTRKSINANSSYVNNFKLRLICIIETVLFNNFYLIIKDKVAEIAPAPKSHYFA